MATPAYHPGKSAFSEAPRALLAPVRYRHPLLDGSWWPTSADLTVELRVLLPLLDQVRGRVARLLLSPGGWASRPHQIIMDDRTVTVGYLAGQSPSMMTVLCADGGTFTMGVAPSAAPGELSRPDSGWDEDTWEAEGGGLGQLTSRAAG